MQSEAVNTIIFTEKGLKGFNTDGLGALKAICRVIPGSLPMEEKFKGKKFLIIGAGGTAKAVACVAVMLGAQVMILNRDERRARSIADKLNCYSGPLVDLEKHAKEGYDILVQATSVGMSPNIQDSLVESSVFYPRFYCFRCSFQS